MKRSLWFIVAIALAAGCSRDPDDLREWRPSDHDHTDNPSNDQVSAAPDSGRPPDTGIQGVNEVTIATWKAKCTTCHGMVGRGDGPRGAMVRARNLADKNWQDTVSDQDLAASIKNGRGEMPAFDLPQETIDGLVKLVRMLVPRPKAAADAGAPEGGTAPANPHAYVPGAPPIANPHAGVPGAPPIAPKGSAP